MSRLPPVFLNGRCPQSRAVTTCATISNHALKPHCTQLDCTLTHTAPQGPGTHVTLLSEYVIWRAEKNAILGVQVSKQIFELRTMAHRTDRNKATQPVC